MRDKLTRQFLNLISSHLSSRSECRNVEYELVISREGEYTFSISVLICRDMKHRSRSYQDNTIVHIIKYHMPEIGKEFNMLDTTKIVPGRYVYMYNMKHNLRNWIKEDRNGKSNSC